MIAKKKTKKLKLHRCVKLYVRAVDNRANPSLRFTYVRAHYRQGDNGNTNSGTPVFGLAPHYVKTRLPRAIVSSTTISQLYGTFRTNTESS